MKKIIYALLICLIVITGIVTFTSEDNDSGSNYNSSYKKESHTCYVCGKSGNMKYGSHYYCKTHWAMVKTVAEAD